MSGLDRSRGPAGAARRTRVWLVCEVLYTPLDEGIRIYAAELARALAGTCEILLVSEKDSQVAGRKVHGALGNRYFLSARLAELAGSFRPDAVIYVAWTSLTARTILRTWSLRRYARGARIGIVALQPRAADVTQRLLARLGRPDVVLSIGPGVQRQAERLGMRCARLPAGVDLGRFRPANAQQREKLKRRAGVDPSAYVVLHVGHLKESRNVGVLERIAKLEGVRCMLVTSSSTAAQPELAARLSGAGVTVMSHHQDRIEFAYRMADAYLFPVTSPLDAIEVPLSVLEAAACDLAIVATRFGGLPDLLGDQARGVVWIPSPEEAVEAVSRLASGPRAAAGTRGLVEELRWPVVAARALEALGISAAGPAPGTAP